MATNSQPPIRSKSVTLLDPTDDNGAYDPPKNSYYPQRSTDNAEVYDEEPADQTTPMMYQPGGSTDKAAEGGHQDAARALAASLSKMQSFDLGGEPEQPSPLGKLAWAGFGLSVLSLTSMCISFASPYWIQRWPLSFSTFENMGLWEACFHNYMHHRDDLQEVYNGCFWVFSSDQKYSKLRDWLLPPWFMACQVMSTICLIILVAVVTVIALVFLHMCPMMNHEYHQIYAMFISGALLFMCTMTTVITSVMFGVQINDRNWMPRPDWNFLSWGFGFLLIAGMTGFAAGMLLFMAASKAYNKLLKLQDNYFHQAMEMSSAYPASMAGQPAYGSGYPEPSYGPGGYSEPSYGPGGYPEDQSYDPDDQSFEKQSYRSVSDKPQFQSQPSYGPSEKSQSRSQTPGGYAPSHRPPAYDASLEPVPSYTPQKSYDGGRSYDGSRR